MIKLYGFGAAFGSVDPSPFVMKVDCFLKMAGLDYELIGGMENLQKAPKGKLPFIEDNGKIIADSHFILAYLSEKYEVDLNSHLTVEQKAQAHLYTKAMEDHLYFILVYSRWMREDTWPIIKETFFSKLPFPLNYIIPKVAKKTVIKNLYHQGTGRHNDDELLSQLKQFLQSLSALLGDKDYFFGEQPAGFDGTAFAFINTFMTKEIDNPFNRAAQEFTNLQDYCRRMYQKYYAKPVAA